MPDTLVPPLNPGKQLPTISQPFNPGVQLPTISQPFNPGAQLPIRSRPFNPGVQHPTRSHPILYATQTKKRGSGALAADIMQAHTKIRRLGISQNQVYKAPPPMPQEPPAAVVEETEEMAGYIKSCKERTDNVISSLNTVNGSKLLSISEMKVFVLKSWWRD